MVCHLLPFAKVGQYFSGENSLFSRPVTNVSSTTFQSSELLISSVGLSERKQCNL